MSGSLVRKIPIGSPAICKSCHKPFTSLFTAGRDSSGEFCTKRCGHSFQTKAKRSEINEKVRKAIQAKWDAGYYTWPKKRSKT